MHPLDLFGFWDVSLPCGDGSPDRGGQSMAADDVCEDRRHEGIEPTRHEPGAGFIRVNLRPPLQKGRTK
jgi:hypothetical protein